MSNYSTEPFNVITLSREDFDRIGTKPSNYLFFVLDKIVKDGSIIDVYSLYKGNVQVGVGDIIQSLPDSMRAANGGFRASAFARSEVKPAKPRESDFSDYHSLVNSRGTWQSRPDNLGGEGQIWVSFHWFTGSPAEALDTGDEWTDPVRLTGLNGADGKDGSNGVDGKDGINGADGRNGKDGADGTGVFIRFNSAASMPDRPTGIGIDGGWGAVQKADSRWISMKQGKTASEGTWGGPVQIRCNLIRYDSSDGTIRDEFGNRLGLAFSPVYVIDTEQVIPLTIYDRYKFDTSTPLRVNCYVSTPQGTRALLNPEDYTLMCKVRDTRQTPIQEVTFELEYANREWMLPLEEWYDRSNETDFIELHLFAKDGAAGDAALSIKLIQLVRDGEAGKISSVRAETLEPGSQATVRNEGDEHDARLVFGIPRGNQGDKGDTGKDGYSVFYTTAAYDTAQAAQISRQFIRNEGRTLQVGDFLIEASANKRLFRISQLTNDYAYCDHIGILRGPKGDTGAKGKDGLNIYRIDKEVSDDTITQAYPDDYFDSRFRDSIKAGECFISADYNLYEITGLTLVGSTGGGDSYYLFDAVKVGNIKGGRGEKGEKGDKGDPFMVRKTYTSVEAMNAGYATDGVPLYGMVLIDTGNVEDEDNAKLYMKGDTAYTFLTDLSGAQGIKGDAGYSFRKGEVASVMESGAAVFTTITPSQGLQAGDIIVGFSDTLGLYGQLYRITDAAALTGTDLGVSLRGPQGIQGERGLQGVQGVQGESGFGMYRTAASMTDTDSDYSLQKSEVDTLGRDLQVGDFIIEGSENSYLWRVKTIQEGGTSVQCGYICSLRGLKGETGTRGATGATGATGAEGLGIWRSSTATSTATTSISLSTITIPAGRSVKVGDLIIANATYSYLYRVTAVSSATATVSYLTTLRGATGAAGQNATTTAVATTTSNGLMSAADKTKLNGAVMTGFPASNNLKPVMKDSSDRGYVKTFDYTTLGDTLEDDVWANMYETDGMNVHDKKLPILRVSKDQSPNRSWVNSPVAAQQSSTSNFMAVFTAYATESYNIRLDAYAFKNKQKTDSFSVYFTPDTANNTLLITWARGGVSQSAQIGNGVDAAGIVAAGEILSDGSVKTIYRGTVKGSSRSGVGKYTLQFYTRAILFVTGYDGFNATIETQTGVTLVGSYNISLYNRSGALGDGPFRFIALAY